MATEQLIPNVNELVVMMEEEVDLCLVCCSIIKSRNDHHLGNNNSQLLSTNLNVFYLLRRVLQVPGIEFKRNLISCGNPVEWIKLCDKCTELTRQTQELHRKLRKIELELSCVQQLIWDKARLSINDEAEANIEQARKSSKIWRRLRKHLENKCQLTKRCIEVEPLISPFAEGDKLANYLTTQKTSTAILPRQHSERNANVEDDRINLVEETNLESSSPSPPSQPTIKIEVTPELDFKDPHLADTLDHHQNDKNLLIDNLLGELGQVKVEFGDQGGGHKEEMEVDAHGGDKVLEDNKRVEEDVDWNWEPDEDDEGGDDDDESEEDQEEEEDDDEVDEETMEGNLSNFLEKSISTGSICQRKKEDEMSKVKRPPPTTQKRLLQKLIRTDDGKIKCRQCDQIFASASGLNSHEREKHSKTPGAFICDICGGAFNSRDYLRKHTSRSHKTNPDGTSAMKNRKMIKSQDGKYQCRHCDQMFASRDGCLAHERNKHSKTPGAFICSICGRAFNSASYLRGHKFQSHNLKADGTPIPPKAPKLERDHICDKCGKGFKTGEQLKKHLRFVHEKSFSIKCSLCGMGWPSKNSLKKHLLALHPEDPSSKKLVEEEGLGISKCPVIGCSVRFLKESSVKGHLKSKHGKEDEAVEELDLGAGVVLQDPSLNVTCSTCGKICVNKSVLKKHEEVHEIEKKFVCDICGVGFVRKEYLKGHVDRMHLKKRKIEKKEAKCELCGKGFRDKALLRDHLEIHGKEGRRDYFCDKCGHGFTLEKYLRIHKRRTNCGEEGKQARVYNRKGE